MHYRFGGLIHGGAYFPNFTVVSKDYVSYKLWVKYFFFYNIKHVPSAFFSSLVDLNVLYEFYRSLKEIIIVTAL